MIGSNYQAIELPYASGQLSMVILLPAQLNCLGQLEAQLSPAFLMNVLDQMSSNLVDLYLPRFTNESSFNLTGTLAQMGMPDAFRRVRRIFPGSTTWTTSMYPLFSTKPGSQSVKRERKRLRQQPLPSQTIQCRHHHRRFGPTIRFSFLSRTLKPAPCFS
jgi:hypothetical protein